MTLSYNKFSCWSSKAKISWVQQGLCTLGFLNESDINTNNTRTKPYVRAVKRFQQEHGLTTNAEINELEFNILLSEVKQKERELKSYENTNR